MTLLHLSLGLAAGIFTMAGSAAPGLELKSGQRTLAIYNPLAPSGTKLVVDSGDFLHPVYTPNGIVITDLAPSDHPHHRGIFLGWVEMHGAKDADFWGWGEHAPIKGRRIINQGVVFSHGRGTIDASSDWAADDVVMIREKLKVKATFPDYRDKVYSFELDYELTPLSDIKLTRWAFSGFCLRTRKEGVIAFFSPDGLVTLANPSHLKPESDWPDAAWYACTVKLETGVAGAAIINHPSNPPTLWHNHRDVRMLNPCIVAPAEVNLVKNKPLRLRYCVVTFDGEVPTSTLNRLAADFRK